MYALLVGSPPFETLTLKVKINLCFFKFYKMFLLITFYSVSKGETFLVFFYKINDRIFNLKKLNFGNYIIIIFPFKEMNFSPNSIF